MDMLDYTLAPLSFAFFGAYHVYLFRRVAASPFSTVIGFVAAAKTMWIHSMMKERRDILAVQSIRNGMMAATLLASTNIVLITVIGSILMNTDRMVALNMIILGSTQPTILVVKSLVILGLYFISFFCFLHCIRGLHQVNYMVCVPSTYLEACTPGFVAKLFIRSGRFYTIGSRLYSIAMASTLWIFGPIPLFVAAVLVIVMFASTDSLSEIRGMKNLASSSNADEIKLEALS